MKVKLIVNQQDKENEFSSIKDYSPINFNEFTQVKQEILGEDNRIGVKRLVNELSINVYAEDLRLPTYILENIYNKVKLLIRSEYSHLEEYIEDFALIASYLNRYSENNKVWSKEFHKQLKNHDIEVSNAIRFINKLQEESMDINSISVKYKENKVPEPLEFTSDAMMKMWVTGFAVEFKKYLKSYQLGLEERDTNKIQNEYYAPMLKAYFEMLHNEGLFKSPNASLLLFGYLAEIAGAFIYDMSVYENLVRKKKEAATKPIYEGEIDKLEKKVQQAVTRKKKNKMTSNVDSIRKIYMKQTGIDVAESPKIGELPELCSLREYVVYRKIKAHQILAVDYISAGKLVIDRYRYHRDKLDALLK